MEFRRLARVVIYAFLLGLPRLALANDGAVVGVPGNWKWAGNGTTKVRMVREKVVLTLDSEPTYAVDADFVFHNDGPATTVKMGFPESGGGVDVEPDEWRHKTAFQDFRTYVDGRRARVKRIFQRGESESYDALWIKTVTFAANQTRKVSVHFRTQYGGEAAEFSAYCNYTFSGGNWNGKVDESVLVIHPTEPASYMFRAQPEEVRGHDLIFRWKNWEAEEDFQVYFTAVPDNWLELADSDVRKDGVTAVTVPGKRGPESYTYLPGAVRRDGEVYVKLRDWAEPLGAGKKPRARLEDDGHKIRVIFRGKAALFESYGEHPAGCVKFTGWGNDQCLYVPISRLQRELGARFIIDPKARTVSALDPV